MKNLILGAMMVLAFSATAGTKIKPVKTSATFGNPCANIAAAARQAYYASGGTSFEVAHAITVAIMSTCGIGTKGDTPQ